MYRELMLLLLCVGIVLSAPQKDSNITYVKRHAKLDEPKLDISSSERESKIENVPLTVPGIQTDVKEGINSTSKETENNNSTKAPDKQPVNNYSDRIYSIKTKPKNITSSEKSIPDEEFVNEEIKVNKTDVIVLEIKDPDIIPAESVLQDIVANENQSITYEDVTESDELVTEKYEAEETTVTTEVDVETTKAPLPKFIPKLSYFEKSTYGSFSQNLIANPGKRRFRSRCRCEKIWNCVKLQISVPRCPEEYFLCCS